MRSGTQVAIALCALVLSACGGGSGGGGSVPSAPGASAPPAPSFSTATIFKGSGQRGVPLTPNRLSLAVAGDGTVGFSNFFEWAIVSFSGQVTNVAASFSGNGPYAFGRGADGGLYAGTWDGGPTAQVMEESPSRRWVVAQTPPVAILDAFGSTWVLTWNGIVRLNADGSTTVLPVVASGVAADAALGPDGAFWIAESDGYVERVPLSGAPVRYPVGGKPARIAAGADGALWFLDGTGSVRRLTTAGAATTIATIGDLGAGDAIARGGDGAMWLTHGAANELVRIATDFSVARYATPSAGVAPSGINSAPDGSLYFVEDFQDGLLLVHAIPSVSAPSVGVRIGSSAGHT